MNDKPWLTDPMYGGMSEVAAQRSYEAWVRGGRQVCAVGKFHGASDAEIALIKRQIETQLQEYEQAILDAEAWWHANKPTGFRAKRRRREEAGA